MYSGAVPLHVLLLDVGPPGLPQRMQGALLRTWSNMRQASIEDVLEGLCLSKRMPWVEVKGSMDVSSLL